MKFNLTKILMIIFVFITLCPAARAFTDKKVEPAKYPDRTFRIEPSYELAEAVAGKSFTLKIKITSDSNARGFLEILDDIQVDEGPPANSQIKFTRIDVVDDSRLLSSKEYVYDVRVGGDADPHRYKIKINVRYLDGEVKPRFFYLNVGVVSKGKLAIDKDEDEGQPTPVPAFETGIFKGGTGVYQLSLKNDFADYTVFIQQISVDSEPEGLIKNGEIPLPEPISLTPSEHKTIPLHFALGPMSFGNMIKGLVENPKLKIHLAYSDGNDRVITDFRPKVAMNVAPSSKVVVGAVLIGLIFGTFIRSILEFMFFKKQITRGGLLRVVTYSIVFGFVIVILFVAGKIQIKAFTVSGSYDNPLAMLLIGLIGALAGLQLLIGWYKSLKSD